MKYFYIVFIFILMDIPQTIFQIQIYPVSYPYYIYEILVRIF